MSTKRLVWIATLLFLAATGVSEAEVQEKWSGIMPGMGTNDEEIRAIGVDASGNCYAAAISFGTTPPDFLLSKYSPNGDVEWHLPINGPGDSADYSTAMVVDGAGNCYIGGATATKGVFGQPRLFIKTTAAGVVDWSRVYDLGDGSVRQMIFDPSGNIIAAGMCNNAGYYPFAMKLSPAGDSLWTTFYKWTGASGGNGQRVACDPAGSVYIVGTTRTSNLDDILTVKFSADGDTLWGRVYDGPMHRYDEGLGLAVDAAGNAYVAGIIKDSVGNPEIVVLKYSSTGELLWDWIYDRGTAQYDEPVGIMLDPNGDLCVGATTIQVGKSGDFTFIKLAPNGDSLSLNYAGISDYEEALGMTLDAIGNMYITGYRPMGPTTLSDCLTMKFDAVSGAMEWEMTWDGISGHDRGIEICTGDEDYVYVGGHVGTASAGKDAGVVAYGPITASVFESGASTVPDAFTLHQNHPNPFNAGTILPFELRNWSRWTLTVFNVLGQEERSFGGFNGPGPVQVSWDGTNDDGEMLPSGIYFYRVTAGDVVDSKTMVLLK